MPLAFGRIDLAHTVRLINAGNAAIAQITFTAYTSGQGGELFTLSEFGLAGSWVDLVFFGNDMSSVPVATAVYNAPGRIMLMSPLFPERELSTQASMSYRVYCFVPGDSTTPLVPAYVPVTRTINGQPLTGDITIQGGGGSANTAQAIVDFGSTLPEETTASATVTAPWVTATSKLLPAVVAGQDHTADEIVSENITVSVGNIIAGTSFDVFMYAPNGASGKFLVNIVGF